MTVITFANTKGGAGKTTAAVLLTSELLHRGYRVCVLDADPQRWLARWVEQMGGMPGLSVDSYISSATLQRTMTEKRKMFEYVIVDMPGIQSSLLASAVGFSNHVIVPIQGSHMDAQGGAHVLDLIRYLDRSAGIRVPHSVVLSRVNPLITTRSMQAVKRLLSEQNIHVFDTPIAERSAFREMFDFNCLLRKLDPARVSNLDKAVDNASRYANEVMALVPASQAVEPARMSLRRENRLDTAAAA
ncbi:ParA family protein [Rhizobium sp. AAP43]|uniref:ParA family protein n=1 Tax=Rhizobium sp. AAP43 TaxID=1523420 RepID=UPI0006B90C48|nr:ParA family protein [Rhizobium sp. AAP43]KPF46095.1 chromosome partitioning protein ParA [Rhizobium sp. AAP43]